MGFFCIECQLAGQGIIVSSMFGHLLGIHESRFASVHLAGLLHPVLPGSLLDVLSGRTLALLLREVSHLSRVPVVVGWLNRLAARIVLLLPAGLQQVPVALICSVCCSARLPPGALPPGALPGRGQVGGVLDRGVSCTNQTQVWSLSSLRSELSAFNE